MSAVVCHNRIILLMSDELGSLLTVMLCYAVLRLRVFITTAPACPAAHAHPYMDNQDAAWHRCRPMALLKVWACRLLRGTCPGDHSPRRVGPLYWFHPCPRPITRLMVEGQIITWAIIIGVQALLQHATVPQAPSASLLIVAALSVHVFNSQIEFMLV